KAIRYFWFFIKTFVVLLIKNYDIVYLHYGSITSIPVLWAAKFKKMNIYTNVHGTDVCPVTDKEKKLERNTEKICGISSKVIVPSLYFKKIILAKYVVGKENCVVF